MPAPASFAGRSLVPLLAGNAGWDEERAIFAEQLWGKRQTLLRTPGRAWVQKESGLELYDLDSDPGEHHDLARDEPAVAADGARRIAEFRARCAQQQQALRAGHVAAPLDPDRTKAKRATDAMLKMVKFDIATLKAAFEGKQGG